MSQYFSGALDLRAYAKGEWVLLEEFRYHSKAGVSYTVPKWFVTDLASIPWLVSPVFDGVDHRDAGVVHDWLYCSQIVSRAVADALFKEMVELLGAGSIRSGLLYAGLRVGGGPRYAACKSGPKVEDFAWEFMSVREQVATRLMFGVPAL